MQIEEQVYFENIKQKHDISTKEILPIKLENSIKNIIKKEGYVKYNVTKKFISTGGGNYLGVLYEVDIKGETIDVKKETNLFIKNILPGDQMKIISIADAYCKEQYAYTELNNIFQELQQEFAVPEDERYVMVKSFDDSNPEAVILENLTRKGFETFNRMDVVSLEFAVQAVTQLAKFHGLSYVLKQKRPFYFEKKIKTLKEPFIFNEEWETFLKNMIDATSNCLNGTGKSKIKAFTSTFLEKMPMYMKDTETINACLCHGDFRPNNILMKKTANKISQVIPIDYQLIHYGCPILDFLYFIFLATDRKFRKYHLEYLKDLYFESMESFLKYFDINMDSIFTRKVFERVYKEKLDYGLMVGVMITPFLFVSEDKVPDLGEQSISNFTVNTNSGFEERIKGIVDDFIEWGYL